MTPDKIDVYDHMNFLLGHLAAELMHLDFVLVLCNQFFELIISEAAW
jgi:hypothetical protein